MNERTIANRALEQLRFQTGLVGHVSGAPSAASSPQTHEAVVSFDRLKTRLVTYLRDGPVTGRAMIDFIEAAKGAGNLVISDYINEEDAERFRESNINYLDNVGNAYLNLAPVYIFIQGKKPRDNYALDKAEKLFTETGLRVIYALLTQPNLLNASYRKIADQAGVSMGTIGWVLRELKNQEFIVNYKSRYAWGQRVKLVKKWVEEYPYLRDKFTLGVYYTQDKSWWQNCDFTRYEAVLGGEVSATESIRGFAAQNAELFIGKHKQQSLIHDLGFIPAKDVEGLGSMVSDLGLARIELLNKFWGVEYRSGLFRPNVHPLLTYASLMDSWDPKSRELAAKTARQFL